MLFKEHSELEGSHAFLGASQSSWLNYDEEKLATTWTNMRAKAMGTRLHEFAAECIRLGQKLPRSTKTLNAYVNDAIGYKMTPEQPLFYSWNCFGTADAISFRKNMLRIHDLKTGVSKVKIEQLMIYAALFCLEYQINPEEIDIELRIYQCDDIMVCLPTAEDIRFIMNKIVDFDKRIDRMKMEEMS